VPITRGHQWIVQRKPIRTTTGGVSATLAWQSYGGAAKQMIADSAPQVSWLLLSVPAMNPPSGPETAVAQPSPPAVQTSGTQAASAQAESVASTGSETAASPALSEPSLELRQLETLSHDLAAVRESVEQLAAGQEQIARDIAKLQTDGQDMRRGMPALPPAAQTTTRKPVPPPQPAPQSSTAALPPPPPQPAPQLSTAPLPPAPSEPPLRPPMPMR
jgi:hypothetical protein